MVATYRGLVGFTFGFGQEHFVDASVFFHLVAVTCSPGPPSSGLALPASGKGSTPLWGWGLQGEVCDGLEEGLAHRGHPVNRSPCY